MFDKLGKLAVRFKSILDNDYPNKYNFIDTWL